MKTSWQVTRASAWTGAKRLCVLGLLGAAVTGCSVDAGLDVINGCGGDIRVYSGANDAHSGTTSRIDELSPDQTASTYVAHGSAVIYVQPIGSNAWIGPLVMPADKDGDGLVTYTVGPDVCGELASG